MNDDMRKRLTLYLGEPWHSITGRAEAHTWCSCGSQHSTLAPFPKNRTYTTWDDLGTLKDKMMEKGDWKSFFNWMVSKHPLLVPITNANELQDYTNWLITPKCFCELMGEWLEQREVKK